jgi:hypothetical protein
MVRSVLGRELSLTSDWWLLAYERMRIIDMAHFWSCGTHSTYQSQLRQVRCFEQHIGHTFLNATVLLASPADMSIPLMWAQEFRSLQTTGPHSSHPNAPLAFGSIRPLHSAVSQFQAWDLMVAHPGRAMEEHHKWLTIQDCRPMDSLACTLFATRLSARIGDESLPATPILLCHVLSLSQHLDKRFLLATSPAIKQELATAGLLNCGLWLSWARPGELLSLPFSTVSFIPPHAHATAELPPNCGALLFLLSPETKTSWTVQASIVIASTSGSGLPVGLWFQRLCHSLCLGSDWQSSGRLVFSHPDGPGWTSKFFRQSFLYPHLVLLRNTGDPYLASFDGSPGNMFEAIYSLYCYHHGAGCCRCHCHWSLGQRNPE